MVVRRNREKGQGLAEFALILPLLLVLILGIFEFGRVIWASITIQAAARDAARYAITGRPYVDAIGLTNGSCLKPDGNVSSIEGTPWKCSAEDRATAIREVALERIRTVVGDNPRPPGCTDPANELAADQYDPNWNCSGEPSAYGVQVVGQKFVEVSLGGSTSMEVQNTPGYAGEQGLNVAVYTFHNVQMMTPIFEGLLNVLSGVVSNDPNDRFVISVRGEVQMQNEGLNRFLANGPPPSIQPRPTFGPGANPCAVTGTCGGKGQEIHSLSGYGETGNIRVGMDINIQLKEHDQSQDYDVYLQANDGSSTQYKICQNIQTSAQNLAEQSCSLNIAGVPAGKYCLYSVPAGSTGHNCNVNPLAKATQELIVSGNTSGGFVMTRDNTAFSNDKNGVKVWAARSKIFVDLVGHPVDEYDVYLTYGNGASKQREIASRLNVPSPDKTVTTPLWRLQPSPEPPPSPCPPSSGKPCIIESRVAMTGAGGSAYTTTEIYITDPVIDILGGGGKSFQQGDTLQVELKDHTPNREYDIIVVNYLTDSNKIGDVIYLRKERVKVDGDGNSNVVAITLDNGLQEWTNGTYIVGSYLVGATSSTLEDNWIAPRGADQQFLVNTTNNPRLSIVGVSTGNYEFPIGSFINIKLHNHQVGDYVLYFGRNNRNPEWQVPTTRSGNTIVVDISGDPVQGFDIPYNAASGSDPVIYKIASYPAGTTPNNDYSNAVAWIEVTITPRGLIQVFELNTQVDYPTANVNVPATWPALNSQYAVLPDADVVIRLRNHARNTNYSVYYASNVNGEKNILRTTQVVQTDNNGSADIPYQLENLPRTPGYDMADPANWGRPFEMYSKQDVSGAQKLVTTTLTLRSVDLVAKDAAPHANVLAEGQGVPYVNQPYTVTFTIQNSATVAISRYFDIDLYHSPAPIAPGQINDPTLFNMPGDYKQWVTDVSNGCRLPLQANQSCSVQQAFTLTQYGDHAFYARANTTRLVNETNDNNNVISATVKLTCQAQPTSYAETFGPAQKITVPGPIITFDAGYDLVNNWTGHGFRGNIGAGSIENDRLVIEHTDGKIRDVANDFYYAYYYDTLISDPDNTLVYAEVEVIEAPEGIKAGSNSYVENDGDKYPGMAGIGLRVDGASQAEDGSTQYNRQYLYFALEWTVEDNYRLLAGWRGDPDSNRGYKDSGSLRIEPNELPVKLRINRTGNIFTFQFKTINDASWRSLTNGATVVSIELASLPQTLYANLFASNSHTNLFRNDSRTIFDNFTYGNQQDAAASFTQWAEMPFGVAKVVDKGYFKPAIDSTYLVLKNKGEANTSTRSDDTESSGYFFFNYTKVQTISTSSGFNMEVTIHDIQAKSTEDNQAIDATGGRVGLELRNSLSNSSGKLQYGLERVKVIHGVSETLVYVPQVIYRGDGGSTQKLFTDTTVQYQVGGGDVSLRMTREEATGFFKFYHRQGGGWIEFDPPIAASGVDKETVAKAIKDQVEVGLFNDSGNRNVMQSTEIAYFNVGFNACEPGKGSSGTLLDASGIPNNPPAGLTLCPNSLTQSSFEQIGFWVTRGGAYRAGGSANQGNYKMAAPTNDGNNPYFYQKLDLPEWIISTTTKLNLNFYRNIDDQNKFESTDVFRAAVVTAEPSGLGTPSNAILLTEKVVVATGDKRSTKAISYDPTVWEPVSLELSLKPGVNLEDYKDQDLYILFYNDSNGENCSVASNCKYTKFFFEDVELAVCTTQPKPDLTNNEYQTHIQGKVTIFKDALISAVAGPGLKVWAYSEGGELYETVTIQNGEYNFYGLPAKSFGVGGTKYFIYAEQVIEDGSTVSVLATDRNVVIEADRVREVTGINLNLFEVARLQQ
jgi:hypothetical protein